MCGVFRRRSEVDWNAVAAAAADAANDGLIPRLGRAIAERVDGVQRVNYGWPVNNTSFNRPRPPTTITPLNPTTAEW